MMRPELLMQLVLCLLIAASCIATAEQSDIVSKLADRADLGSMNLSHMNLCGRHLNQSNLTDADLSGSI